MMDDDDMHMGNGTGGGMMMMMMPMYFTEGTEVSAILWESWSTKTKGQYAGAIVAVLFFGIVRHLFTLLRQKIGRRANFVQARAAREAKDGLLQSSPAKEKEPELAFLDPILRSWFGARLLDSLLFGFVLTLAYFNMLVAMTYNVGLFVAVIVGEMLGIFFFRPADVSQAACHV